MRDGNFEVYVMDADGRNPVNLTRDPADDFVPSWSPDGRQISFHSFRDGNFEVYVMDADGTNPVRLTDNPANDSQPSWSPDGTRIVFTSYRDSFDHGEVYVTNADGTDLLEANPDQEAIVFEGQTALELTAAHVWAMQYVPPAPLDPAGYETLRFAFHPGAVTPSATDAINVACGAVRPTI